MKVVPVIGDLSSLSEVHQLAEQAKTLQKGKASGYSMKLLPNVCHLTLHANFKLEGENFSNTNSHTVVCR